MATTAKRLAAWAALGSRWGFPVNTGAATGTTPYRNLSIHNFLTLPPLGLPGAVAYSPTDLQALSEAFGTAQIKLYFDGATAPEITRDLDISRNSQHYSARKQDATGKDIQVEVNIYNFVGTFKFANAQYAVELDYEEHNRHRRSP